MPAQQHKPARYTITAALPYTNGPIDIGHLAGVYVPADIYARYLRLTNNDVAFVCGSDEHGVAISMKAKKEGITPKDVIDKYNGIIKKSFQDFGITFDNYSRTSAEIHHKTASEFFTTLHEKGEFIEETTAQLYDAEAKQFLADRFVVGTCPKCGYEEAYGDQCESCGSTLNATDLINPKSTISGAVPNLKETKHWFLPLDKHEAFLKEWILEGHKKDWKPNVYGQCKSWIEEPYWKSDDTKMVHFIGKDNIVFHCIIFPAILKAHGGYILPENVPANEFLNLEGNKLSTSKNWAVWLHEYLEEFPDMQDVLRYTLTANAPETKDNDFTWKDFQARNNNELVAIFGNFVNRVAVLTHKYYQGIVPEPGKFSAVDITTLAALKKYPEIISSSIERYRFREAGQELMNLARLGNKYLADEEPWKLIKTEEERVKTVMYVALQIASALAILSEPFLPFTSTKLKGILQLDTLVWENVALKEVLIASNHQINKAELLFRKIEDKEVQMQLDKLEATKKANEIANKEVAPQKDTITFEDFSKLDVRVGTIIEAKKMAKAKKLLVLKVDTGIDTRTIVSGIAESFTPEEIIGKQVTVLVNLAPRALRGVESEGMILMTENAEGKLVFVNPDADGVSNGETIS